MHSINTYFSNKISYIDIALQFLYRGCYWHLQWVPVSFILEISGKFRIQTFNNSLLIFKIDDKIWKSYNQKFCIMFITVDIRYEGM